MVGKAIRFARRHFRISDPEIQGLFISGTRLAQGTWMMELPFIEMWMSGKWFSFSDLRDVERNI